MGYSARCKNRLRARPRGTTGPALCMSEKPLRILVVDDHQEIRALLAEYLALSGCWVESCPDATTALARMEQDGFDVLLTHLQLPDADSSTLIEELTRRGRRPPRVLSMSHPSTAAEPSAGLRRPPCQAVPARGTHRAVALNYPGRARPTGRHVTIQIHQHEALTHLCRGGSRAGSLPARAFAHAPRPLGRVGRRR